MQKSEAATEVQRGGVEKEVFQNDLCHPYSCHVVLNYLDAAFPKTGLDFLRHRFHADFSTNAGKRFIYNLSSLIAWQASATAGDGKYKRVSCEIGIHYTYGYLYGARRGLWTSVGVFVSARITSKTWQQTLELFAKGENCISLRLR